MRTVPITNGPSSEFGTGGIADAQLTIFAQKKKLVDVDHCHPQGLVSVLVCAMHHSLLLRMTGQVPLRSGSILITFRNTHKQRSK